MVVDGVAVVVRKAEVVSIVELVGGVEVCGVGGGCCRDCGGMGAEGWWVVWGDGWCGGCRNGGVEGCGFGGWCGGLWWWVLWGL